MSGGRWNYLQYKLADMSDTGFSALEMLGAVEHVLDWGACGDTCYECAKIQAIKMLEAFFDSISHMHNAQSWHEIENVSYCESCIARYTRGYPPA